MEKEIMKDKAESHIYSSVHDSVEMSLCNLVEKEFFDIAMESVQNGVIIANGDVDTTDVGIHSFFKNKRI